jgi:hypothetical protein
LDADIQALDRIAFSSHCESLRPYLFGLSKALESLQSAPVLGGVAAMTSTWICAAAWLGINAAFVGLRFRVTQQDSLHDEKRLRRRDPGLIRGNSTKLQQSQKT